MPPYKSKVTMLPDYMQESMLRYIELGDRPGAFLRAVLCNDLFGAYKNADSHNALVMKVYAEYMYNFAPANCYGSEARFDDWVKAGGLKGKGLLNDD